VENCQSYTINDTRCDDIGPRSLSWDRTHSYPNMAVLNCNAARTLLREHTPTCEGTPFIAPASWPSRRPSRATNTALSACRSRSWPPVCHQQVSLPQRDTSLIAWWLCRPRGEAARLPSVCPVGCHPCRNSNHGQATLQGQGNMTHAMWSAAHPRCWVGGRLLASAPSQQVFPSLTCTPWPPAHSTPSPPFKQVPARQLQITQELRLVASQISASILLSSLQGVQEG
jgi:hypothetical protein